MKNPNLPDDPEAANAPIPSEPITLPPGWEEPDEWWVDWWSKGDFEDVMTYLIFAEDGSVEFKVVHDGESFGSSFCFVSRYKVDASLRGKLFSSFLETLPAEEALLRFAFAKAIKKALKPSAPESLLVSKGIPYTFY